MSDQIKPEFFLINPTPHIPNSKLPILIYRNALQDTSQENILNTIEPNGWLTGGRWTTYRKVHFHTTVHECYAVIKGSTTYQLGKSPLDPDINSEGQENGKKMWVQQGDVFVLPAGVSHCSLESEGDYEYIGLYPKEPSGAKTRFDMNYGLQPEHETAELAAKCEQLPIPAMDPLYGQDGPLPKMWREAVGRS